MEGEKEGEPIISEEPLLNLDSIPFANYDSLKPSVLGIQTGSIFTSFSCPFRCKFCANYNFTGAHGRRMSPKRVVEEITHQNKGWGSTFFNYGDSTILPNEASFHKMVEINNLLDKMGLELDFFLSCHLDIIARLDRENPQLLDHALRKANIFFVGVENVNNKILFSYNKHLSSDNAKRGIDALLKRGKMCRNILLFTLLTILISIFCIKWFSKNIRYILS